ncbi:MAG: hypothetical protein ACI9ZH_001656 [Paracoccaceae bacterium]|jgi:long-chain fatty acid transport protein
MPVPTDAIRAAVIATFVFGAAPAFGAGLNQEGADPLGLLQADSVVGLEVSGTLRRPSSGLSDAQNGYGWTGSTRSGANPPRYGAAIAARARVLDSGDCMARAHQPYGRWERRDAGWAAANDFAESRLETGAVDAACSWRFALDGTARLRVIGGVRAGMMEVYHQLGLPAHLAFHLTSDKIAFGWRAGLSYEDEGLRLSALYTAPMTYSLTGAQYTNGARGAGTIATDVTMPASVALRAERDLAPGWRIAADAEWTQWSAFDAMRVSGVSLPGGATGVASFATGFDDTLSFAGSAEHDLSESWTVGATVRWDQGVGGAITDLVTVRGKVARRLGAHSLLELSGTVDWQMPGETSGVDAVTGRSWSYRAQGGPSFGAGVRLVLGF